VNLSHLTEKTKVEWPMSMFLHPNYEKTVVWCQLKFAETLVTVGLCSEWSKSHLLATAVTLLSLANMSIPKCFKVYLAHSAESVCKDFSASPHCQPVQFGCVKFCTQQHSSAGVQTFMSWHSIVGCSVSVRHCHLGCRSNRSFKDNPVCQVTRVHN